MITTNEAPKILDINLSIELSPKCPTPAPMDEHNPDLAILKQEDGQQKNYMIRATKSTTIDELFCPIEVARIECGKRHFVTIGINDCTKTPSEA
ncbi:hypothetical protein [Bifidobacterium aquikefiri]|uniref:restriction endonuclease n=1 Tax=Bifidobacterium aquikefiri TaxID=1653207 RepID=UPI0039E84283